MDDTGRDQDDDAQDDEDADTDDADTGEDDTGDDDDSGDDDGGDDESDDEGTADDGPSAGEADDGSRLEELGDRIESVRAQAEDAVEGVAEPDEKYHESGSEESKEADDQTAAPG